MRALVLISCVTALAPPNPGKPPIAPIEAPKTTPARLPAYEPPNLAPQTEVCAEHGEPVATKTVLKGSNKGREYYCCSNAIPCGHFRWVPQKVPLPTGRLAGDANQRNRVQEQRKVVSKRPADVAEEWLNGTLTRVVYRGDTGFTIARVLPDGEKNSFEEEGYANPCLLYTSPSPRDKRQSRMPSSA